MEASPDRRWQQLGGQIAETHGVISRRDLLARGFDPSWLRRRIDSGRLVVVLAGVYRLEGMRLGEPGRFMAAALNAGPGAAIGDRSALALHDLIRHRGDVVVVRSSGCRPRADRRKSSDGWGVRISRKSLPASDRAIVNGIPTLRVERAICDSAPGLTADVIRSVLVAAEQRRSVDWRELVRRSAPGPGRPDLGVLREIIGEWLPEMAATRSEMEERTLQVLVVEGGLPEPLVNHRIGRWVADFYWPDWDLVVEVDGYAFHSDRVAFGRDRRKDRELLAMGIRVVRFTWREVTGAGSVMAAEIERLAGGRTAIDRSPLTRPSP